MEYRRRVRNVRDRIVHKVWNGDVRQRWIRERRGGRW